MPKSAVINFLVILSMGLFLTTALPELISDPYGKFSFTEGCNCLFETSSDKCDANGQCECRNGFYGPDCSIRCSCMNPAHNVCDPYDGNCYCHYLFNNPMCSNRCQCHLDNTDYCYKRKCHCKLGFYGKSCDLNCNCGPNMLDGSCDELGYCKCRQGYYGKNCQKECNCHRNTLHPLCTNTGRCFCMNGFKGKLCRRSCNCNSNGTFHDICAQISGICNCKEGYTGKTCNATCSCNFRNTLKPSCDVFDTCICKPGFYGKHCDRRCYCENTVDNLTCNAEGICPCLPTYHGKYCENACNCNRSVFNQCDYRGHCACLPGFYGKRCDKACTHCHGRKSTGNCDFNGYCQCREGYYGRTCGSVRMGCGQIYADEWYSRKAARIVNGVVPNNPVPWLVRIYLRGVFVCNGAILNNFYVATIAECFVRTEEASQIRILAGEFTIDVPDASEKWFYVDKMILPPRVDGDRTIEDVVLLKLKFSDSNGLVFSTTIQPACIPKDKNEIITPINTFYAGWGYTNNYVRATVLRTEAFSMISSSECENRVDTIIRPNIICVAPATNEAFLCIGDKGTPLTLVMDGVHYLVGLHVRGHPDCLRSGISFFSNFSKYTNWARYQLANYIAPTLPP